MAKKDLRNSKTGSAHPDREGNPGSITNGFSRVLSHNIGGEGTDSLGSLSRGALMLRMWRVYTANEDTWSFGIQWLLDERGGPHPSSSSSSRSLIWACTRDHGFSRVHTGGKHTVHCGLWQTSFSCPPHPFCRTSASRFFSYCWFVGNVICCFDPQTLSLPVISSVRRENWADEEMIVVSFHGYFFFFWLWWYSKL